MAAQAVAPATLELSCLSSDLLSKVSHFLNTIELRIFDTAINNRLLRSKFLFGVSNDTFLFPGRAFTNENADLQQRYARWLLLRRVFLKSITLTRKSNAATLLHYDIHSGLEKLTLNGKVNFPKDLAVRNAKTLHKLVLTGQGKDGLRSLLERIREWREAGGVLKELILNYCEFGDLAVDVGNCDSLTLLYIKNCRSNQYTAPGILQGCTRLIWDIVSKCTNLQNFHLKAEPSCLTRT
jgi:hypothetical protein